jgi:nitrogen-specific signal transduction histidine kinase
MRHHRPRNPAPRDPTNEQLLSRSARATPRAIDRVLARETAQLIRERPRKAFVARHYQGSVHPMLLDADLKQVILNILKMRSPRPGRNQIRLATRSADG